MKRKCRIAFICIHNSCRSQIAEALGKKMASDLFECYSAGTEAGTAINSDAIRLIKSRYGIDMEKTQYPKSLEEIPNVDFVITMGCGVACPHLTCRYREDWQLEDPTGKSDHEFVKIIDAIEQKIRDLKKRFYLQQILF
jgi:arsenate reductase